MENNSCLIFIDKFFSEREILKILNENSGLGFESLNYPKEVSEYFVSYDAYTKGIKISVFISWPKNSKHRIDCLKFCKHLATSLEANIIFESYEIIECASEYILFDKNAQLYSVEVIDEYTEDDFLGVSIKEDSLCSLD